PPLKPRHVRTRSFDRAVRSEERRLDVRAVRVARRRRGLRVGHGEVGVRAVTDAAELRGRQVFCSVEARVGVAPARQPIQVVPVDARPGRLEEDGLEGAHVLVLAGEVDVPELQLRRGAEVGAGLGGRVARRFLDACSAAAVREQEPTQAQPRVEDRARQRQLPAVDRVALGRRAEAVQVEEGRRGAVELPRPQRQQHRLDVRGPRVPGVEVRAVHRRAEEPEALVTRERVAEDAPPGPRLVGGQERPAHGRVEEDRVGKLDAALPRRPQPRRPRPKVEARVLALHDDDVVARGPVHAVAAVRDEDEDHVRARRVDAEAEEVARVRGGVRRVLRIRVDDERLLALELDGPLSVDGDGDAACCSQECEGDELLKHSVYACISVAARLPPSVAYYCDTQFACRLHRRAAHALC
ncbi:unnamed protein product, partial [Pelagomonas calceolata]